MDFCLLLLQDYKLVRKNRSSSSHYIIQTNYSKTGYRLQEFIHYTQTLKNTNHSLMRKFSFEKFSKMVRISALKSGFKGRTHIFVLILMHFKGYVLQKIIYSTQFLTLRWFWGILHIYCLITLFWQNIPEIFCKNSHMLCMLACRFFHVWLRYVEFRQLGITQFKFSSSGKLKTFPCVLQG